MMILVQDALMIYLGIEIAFVIVFYAQLLPFVNRPCQPAPYLAYGKDRKRLLLRVLKRIEDTSKRDGTCPKESLKAFLRNWFHVDHVPSDLSQIATAGTINIPATRHEEESSSSSTIPVLNPSYSTCTSSSSSCGSVQSDDDDSTTTTTTTTTIIPTLTCTKKSETTQRPPFPLYKEDMDSFFAFAFFSKELGAMRSWERKELKKLFQVLERRHNLTFPNKKAGEDTSHMFHPRRMTLEPVVPIYRPLIVYLLVLGMRWVGALVLRHVYGFEKFVTKHGMICWYRSGTKADSRTDQRSNDHKGDSSSLMMPILFFHGIAPGGVVGYLPIVLHGLATEPERPVFLFENISISCVLDFKPLTEKQTVDGVMECLKRFGANQQNLSLVGHSFGSCPIAWLVASKKMEQQIKQVVLLDPVAILLSEPDVMVNFLYAEAMDKTRIVASSEIMTQSYLRRHFAWYNSELYVEDVKCPMLVFCSEHDEIVNSEKVKQEMQRHHQQGHQFQCWEGVGHGACIVNPYKWTEIKRQMLEQELHLLRAR
ncbi:unnamed protein product [Cylindrotheca closterium]|uniref:BAAT/Acyl-CoA thioester hydrolase C-terminal domain-containing protein n=1 Tax=Cylindrotheca closterium TaxID=2856 RepID=A0AAD2CBY2_9STRA|nr:unnamed protein product [Cylindrotheca closterium]